MKALLNTLIVSALLLLSGTLFAASMTDPLTEDDESARKANKTMHKSVMALDHLMEDPDNCIPPSLIEESEGIVIFPGALKVAIGVAGGQGARGVALVRLETGLWSNPFFVSMGEGSLGLQLGAQKSDIVLLFKDKNDIMGLDKTELPK